MKALAFISLLLCFTLFLERGMSKHHRGRVDHRGGVEEPVQAYTPPRGWNSYDSFCWVVSEEEFLANARLVAQYLLPHGYKYVVVDYLWYRRNVPGANTDSLGYDVIDEWGRMVPDPKRWPSSIGGRGFSEVANRVHEMGLKFGIHVMRGISTQAFNANTPILDVTTGKAYEEAGKKWYAKDIAIPEKPCAWMTHGFMSVDTNLGAGRAFLRSLHQQYADWGVDFVKHDCVFGDDFNLNEIAYVSKILRQQNRPILYSLSPGTGVTPSMARDVSALVNMYRITGDDWDNWNDVASHFDIARDIAAADMIGTQGLKGKSWPDLDMLPLGWLTNPGTNSGPNRYCKLTLVEQRTQMTLWSMAKSPLMFGGDMRKLDSITFGLITNPTLLWINTYSSNNMEFPYIRGENCPSLGDCNQKKHDDADASEELVFALNSCKDSNTKGWSTMALSDDLEQVCWTENSNTKHQEPFCLYKENPHVASDEEMACKRECQGKLQLRATERREFCLGGSPNRKLTAKEFNAGSFLPCRLEDNQMWELYQNGTIRNSYSGLCASLKAVQANPVGIRSWLATGVRGEIFVAFFNLNPEQTVISTTLPDIAKALPGQNFASCSCKELWSGKEFVVRDALSISVEPHGSALFTLNCT